MQSNCINSDAVREQLLVNFDFFLMRLSASLKCPLFFHKFIEIKKSKKQKTQREPKEKTTTSEISKAINFYLMFTEAYFPA